VIGEIKAELTANEERLRQEVADFDTLFAEARAELHAIRRADAEQHARRQRPPRNRFGRSKR